MRLKVKDEGLKSGKQDCFVNMGVREVKFNNVGPHSLNSSPSTLMHRIGMGSMRLVSNRIAFHLTSFEQDFDIIMQERVVGKLKVNGNVKD